MGDDGGRLPGRAVAYYAEHRLAHRWAFLWRFHAVHHSPTQLDWLAATRLHPVEGLIGGFILRPPLIVLGFEPADFAIGAAVLGILDVMVHANVNWRLRFLDGIVVTPEYHRWHHVSAPVRDVNFSLPVIDKLFGTYYMPGDGSRPEVYGIDQSFPADGYLRQLAWPFRRTDRSRPGTEPGLRIGPGTQVPLADGRPPVTVSSAPLSRHGESARTDDDRTDIHGYETLEERAP